MGRTKDFFDHGGWSGQLHLIEHEDPRNESEYTDVVSPSG
jgi:hypothetical protein